MPSRDFSIFGVTGTTKVLGVRTVKVPAGTFKALAVQIEAEAGGLPVRERHADDVASRRSKGLVKLVFRHGDGSVSTVTLLR